MDNWNWFVVALGLAFLSGALVSEVICMLLEGRPYYAAVIVFCAIIIMVTARKLE